jgi:hypothetical protein
MLPRPLKSLIGALLLKRDINAVLLLLSSDEESDSNEKDILATIGLLSPNDWADCKISPILVVLLWPSQHEKVSMREKTP